MPVGEQAHDADQQDAENGDTELAELPRLHDQIAHAALGRDEFGRDQHAEGEAEADPQPGGDVGQRRRHGNPQEQRRAVDVHRARRAQQHRRDRCHPAIGVGEDRKNAPRKMTNHFEGSPRPNQTMAIGIQASGGIGRSNSTNGRASDQPRIPAGSQAERDAGEGGEREAPANAPEADGD